jgi:uncharacterized repeat protein (TIGR01451 family)
MYSTTPFVTPSWRRTPAALCTLLTALALTGLAALPAHAATRTFAYVTHQNSNSVAVIDTATNTVTATLTGLGLSPFAVAFAEVGTVTSADLAVSLTDSADPVSQGGTFTYTATVTNHGPDAATGATATITLSGAARTIVSATSSQGPCTVAAPAVNCTLGALANGTSATVTVIVKSTATGTLTAAVTAAATEDDPTPTNNTAAQSTTVTAADIDVNLGAQPHLGLLVPYLTYTLTAHNTGPGAVISATLTATLPPGKKATNLAAGCVTAPGTVTCTYGAIAGGASAGKTFRIPLRLLSLGKVTVTGARTTSAPADPNPANDHAGATCTVISFILATCR